jgi:uncharacterized membrane protein
MQQMNGETSFDQAVLLVSLAVEFAGVAIIVVGFLVATLHVIRRLLRGNDGEHLTTYRHDLGQSMLLGLDFLVAGDIISTVIVANSINDVLGLGLIVIIRTVLVFTIHLEVEGRWPWQSSSTPDIQRPDRTT